VTKSPYTASMRRLATAMLTTASVLASTLLVGPTPAGAAPVREQWRSYWVDSFHNGIFTPAQVDKLVIDARAANVNALIVQVGRWADCFCNRSSFPRTHAAIAALPYDPLDYVIEKAHAAGIEVHAWVNATPVWNSSLTPPQPDHIMHAHGHSATGADKWLNKRYDGSEIGGTNMRSLDLANPAAVNYYVDGMASIAREYDIDGIHLDYIRYPDHNSTTTHSDWGYSEVSLARFRAATARTDTPLPSDPQFSQWRRDQVTTYVRKIYLALYSINPRLRLSHSGITYGYGPQSVGGWENTRTYSEVYQDWKGWLAEGIMDLSVAMNYKREHLADQQQMYREWTEVLADWQGRRATAVGPALYLNTIENSLIQARKALEPSAAGNTVAGWSGYSYASPNPEATADGRLADAERAKLVEGLTVADPTGAPPLFADKANVPDMPWKTRPTRGHVAGTVTLTDGTALDQAPVTMTNILTGQKLTGRLTDGSGWFGFVDVVPWLWLVTVKLPRGVYGVPLDIVHVTRGKLVQPRFPLLLRR
jgi:uncharacterized lipoprotein YddW (UPF0748 family)